MNLINLLDVSKEQIQALFRLADEIKNGEHIQSLKGKLFILFFPESSIRTRITFEKGIKDLGGECILFPPVTLDKREKFEDVIGYIENYADTVIVRHSDYTKIEELAKYSKIPVINAMTSKNHPCEILSDIYGLSKLRSNYLDLTYTFIGFPGNILQSWVNAAKVLGLKLNHVSLTGQKVKENDENYFFTTKLDEVLKKTDILLSDSIPSEYKIDSYLKDYQVTLARLEQAKPNVLFNPCPPFYRGEEVSNDAIDSSYFVGYAFKENLIYMQQAIILYCLNH